MTRASDAGVMTAICFALAAGVAALTMSALTYTRPWHGGRRHGDQTTRHCPPGFGGPDCQAPTCDGRRCANGMSCDCATGLCVCGDGFAVDAAGYCVELAPAGSCVFDADCPGRRSECVHGVCT